MSVMIIAMSVMTCANTKADSRQGENAVTGKAIEEVLKEHTEELMSVPGVVGTASGICEGRPCIKVYVIRKTTGLEQEIPSILEGYPVLIEETGEIRALPETQKD